MTKALYIHIPFCHDICGYCDFVRVGYYEPLVDKYLIELRKDLLSVQGSFTSIYVGGGTPSALNQAQLELFCDSIQHLISKEMEITFEVNPDSLTLEKAKLFKQYGIDRISLGVQSTNDEMLKRIGRTHSFSDVIHSINLLKTAGLTNISIDLMYGLPGQTIEDLASDLTQFLNLDLPHISLYSLTIEPNSEFGRKKIKEVESDLETKMYLLIQSELIKAGYKHYEISNYAKPNFESKHNLSYWHYDDFKGVGIGAAGKENHVRYMNAKNMDSYLKGLRQYDELINLSKEDEIFEHVMMNLRLSEGLDLNHFYKKHQVDFLEYYDEVVTKYLNLGLLVLDQNKIKATDDGRLMLHDILVDFISQNNSQ